jgi:hypothetical protein
MGLNPKKKSRHISEYYKLIHCICLRLAKGLFWNVRERQGILGCFGGSSPKITQYLSFTTVVPREPAKV